ncbi:hypothetical protein M758_10G077400 [Ceratodon purpureus]|uniref:Uncharacterized protein n=1 Tax=Ceratodon purpureus TaxID=3225 RepID=A0A8T0GHZ6_CERPU|nr:hypothetical protein KC19_10G079000 [Ceratodon purpureus]KAG0603233.1 hypothetical protein M758_10G077400 [Ceratodon purpureus]
MIPLYQLGMVLHTEPFQEERAGVFEFCQVSIVLRYLLPATSLAGTASSRAFMSASVSLTPRAAMFDIFQVGCLCGSWNGDCLSSSLMYYPSQGQLTGCTLLLFGNLGNTFQ